ncbi:protein of unknown function UPF0182 [Methanohalobium evestigatum Z-7303]|uniref:UPF0182 protein Metev_0519 n=1 Tax=Methanohalobium evestigatum (strain ATCC BAA-1072 / DSM 3721 / NBRC 107634 / OCM 161 / Z-7303) TaxID=644295 RepID=D7E889_METEZ|nr:UPF0182 family protein [Methanohalobium evestigatum]ADI73431.1 protein of unknown function UPF0182 [Methanohalobium evestigatum Z-7303]
MQSFKPIYLFIALLAIILGIGPLLGIYMDYLWFGMVDYTSVFTTILQWKIVTVIPGFILAFIFLYINIKFARNSIDKILTDKQIAYEKIDYRLFLIGTVFLSFLFGLVFSGNWRTILLYLNSTPFGIQDPILLNDVGFYIFQLPFFHMLRGVLLGLVIITLIIAGALYVYRLQPVLLTQRDDTEEPYDINPEINIKNIMDKVPKRVLVHVSVLLAFIFALIAVGFFLNRYEILFTQQGAVAGAGYTDVFVRLPIFTILTVLSALTAVALLANIKLKNIKVPLIGIGLIVLFVLASAFVPSVYQQYAVEPTELQREEPFLEHSINFTREAYGLSDADVNQLDVDTNITNRDIEENEDIISNIRIWDHRALRQSYRQLQQIRTYYTFNDVDIDRYRTDENYQQYMLAVRELDIDGLPPQARNWVNERLIYTHGFGMVMNPVSTKTADGQPELALQDIPPRGDFEIENPRVYYGESTNEYKIVNTLRQEFDYPRSEGGNVLTNYDGKGGVQMDSFFKRLAYAFRFGEPKFILSEYITDDSRVMYHQHIEERTDKIAPFLEYDSDPYPVIHDGRIHWIIDAYTTASRYPYSDTYYGSEMSGINYLQNPVKVVIDSYDGSVDYYIIEEEPVVETYSKIFPDLFKSYEQMPENLKQHIRYPVDYFEVQMELYRNYHMTDPVTFYNREDSWDIPEEQYRGTSTKMEPYYMITRLPGSDELEYILLQPFTPRERQNMISWIAARSDEPHYGEIKDYRMQKGELVYGPTQIEARIDQNPEISEQLTLWGQSGSNVIRGNLLVVPIGNSILYTEPIFISAEESEIPELRRVVASSGNRVVMSVELRQALEGLAEGRVDGIDPGTIPGEPVVPRTAQQLAQQALEHYETAQEHLRAGNWSAYGEEIEQMRDVLNQLSQELEDVNTTETGQ